MKYPLIASMLLAMASQAGACTEEDPSHRYLVMIQSQDWDGMRGMLTADARYYDPTMTYFDRPAVDLTGPKPIVAFWQSATDDSGTTDIRYIVDDCFQTGEYRTYNLDLAVDIAGATWGVDRDSVTITGNLVSVIRVVDGRIAEHVDYAAGERLAARLRERYGEVK